jgi:hypothetical protein
MKGEATIQPPPLIEALHVISHIVSLCVLLHVDPVTRGTDIAVKWLGFDIDVSEMLQRLT